DIEVIAGVNLPMLAKLAKLRGSLCLVDAVQCAEDAGRKYIASGTEITNATHPRRACG
ncbi:MAG TPA: PTS fructose transporter subunit IIA, partial [Acetobacteraceae bacterium]|nr:PTS fructose transporter subunit IIA [Acetobacteraceae bacterium]